MLPKKIKKIIKGINTARNFELGDNYDYGENQSYYANKSMKSNSKMMMVNADFMYYITGTKGTSM